MTKNLSSSHLDLFPSNLQLHLLPAVHVFFFLSFFSCRNQNRRPPPKLQRISSHLPNTQDTPTSSHSGSFMLHRSLSFLDGTGGYVRLMFFDFTSAFNTIQPLSLREKLVKIGVDPIFSTWIYNHLTGRAQFVRLGKTVSGTTVSNIGAPQGTVLAPFLFTIHTARCI